MNIPFSMDRKREHLPLLGNDILSQFEFSIDQIHGTLGLRPINGPKVTGHAGECLILLSRIGRTCKVMYVKSNDETRESGILRGDTVYSIDGIDCSKVDAGGLNSYLVGEQGQSRTIVFKSVLFGKRQFVLHCVTDDLN